MRPSLFLGTIAVLATLSHAPAARACGGCFAPPDTPTVVTDHRMVLSISPVQTTLYDQIRYQGDPAAFAWVLPIRGTVSVGLSSDVLFGALDALTETRVVAPLYRCPLPPLCPGRARRDSPPPPPSNGARPVVVHKEEVVGPYETVQLSATDPTALQEWLAQNGFAVPPSVAPVLATYVAAHSDFLAMKLVPGASVRAMRPVRITSAGASGVLPLRMIAAGTGATVGITLWVVAEGRYEPRNFEVFQVQDEEIVWDWATSSSNYREVRRAKTVASGGRAWELESSGFVDKERVAALVEPEEYSAASQPGRMQAARDDLRVLLDGVPGAAARITRLRADLSREALDQDLDLWASPKQHFVPTTRSPAVAVNASCPPTPTCPPEPGLPPPPTSSSLGGGGCATGPTPTLPGAAVACLVLVLTRARRKRTRTR